MYTINGHEAAVTACSFAPAGDFFASCSADLQVTAPNLNPNPKPNPNPNPNPDPNPNPNPNPDANPNQVNVWRTNFDKAIDLHGHTAAR